MINKRWIKLSSFKFDNLESIKNHPESWLAVKLINRSDIRLLTGMDLLIIQFDFVFFQDNQPDDSIDTSWLIFISDGKSSEEIKDTLLKYSSTIKNKFSPSLRSPLLRNESKWVSAILDNYPDSKVYAKYEGDDVLVFENTSQGLTAFESYSA